MEWNLSKLEQAWAKWQRTGILSDDVPHTFNGFSTFVTLNGSVWFELVEVESDKQIGLIYLNDFVRSLTYGRFNQATFHAVIWDPLVSRHVDLGKKFLQLIFSSFKLHRLQAEIPLRFKGAIKVTKSLGFSQEGTLRRARLYKGQWYNVLVLGLLEDEVDNG
jgi:Acetyltransferases, including N-acetylases of ribosomal proteins